MKVLPTGQPWIIFRAVGGAYTPEWMVQAAIDRIYSKIEDYEDRDLHTVHTLDELYLLCYYCDEALLHNTPIDAPGFDFMVLVSKVAKAVTDEDGGVFNKVFLFNPYEAQKVVQVYPATVLRKWGGVGSV